MVAGPCQHSGKHSFFICLATECIQHLTALHHGCTRGKTTGDFFTTLWTLYSAVMERFLRFEWLSEMMSVFSLRCESCARTWQQRPSTTSCTTRATGKNGTPTWSTLSILDGWQLMQMWDIIPVSHSFVSFETELLFPPCSWRSTPIHFFLKSSFSYHEDCNIQCKSCGWLQYILWWSALSTVKLQIWKSLGCLCGALRYTMHGFQQ